MRTYSASVRQVNCTCKRGYYPSDRVAANLAEHISFVLEVDSVADGIKYYFTTGDSSQLETLLTPAEMRNVKGLLHWWVEKEGKYVKTAYIVLNLNTGASVVFIDRSRASYSEELY